MGILQDSDLDFQSAAKLLGLASPSANGHAMRYDEFGANNSKMTPSGSPVFTGLSLTGLTAGSVPFAGASGVISQDNSNLFWDATNKRLGVNQVAPIVALSNYNATVNDGATGLAAASLAWVTGAAGYSAALWNTSAGASCNGLLVKSAGTGSTNRVANFLSGSNQIIFLVRGDGVLIRTVSANAEQDQYLATITTTNSTQTTALTIPIVAGYTYLIEMRFIGRRTGGSAGTADDGCSYVRRATYTTKSSTVTCMDGTPQPIDTDQEDQAGFNATMTISSTNVLGRVTGATNNNMSWLVDANVLRIAS